MITQLIATRLRSEAKLLSIVGAGLVIVWLLMATLVVRGYPTGASTVVGAVALVLVAAGCRGRELTQKRERLLAQLPVTGLEIRIAHWLTMLIVLATPIVVWLVLFSRRILPYTDAAGIAAAVALILSAVIIFIALVEIGNNAGSFKPPYKVGVRTGVLLFFFLLLLQIGLLSEREGPFVTGKVVDWALVLPVFIGTAIALIVADILLDQLADHRLR